jgi:Glycosyltransferase
MNIINFCLYAGSKKYGMEYRAYFLAREWAKNHKVFIFTSSFSHTRFLQPIVKKDLDKEVFENIIYYYFKGISYSCNGILRLINYFSFIWKLFRYRNDIAELKPDLIIASSTYPLDVFPAYLIAKKTGAKLVTEFPDLMPLTLTDVVGLSSWHPFVILLGIAERFACRNSDKVVCVLPRSYEHFKSKGLEENNFVFIPNGASETDFENLTDIPESLEHLICKVRKKSKFIVGYAGYQGILNNLTTLNRTADLLRDKDVSFILVGDGPEKKSLIKFSQDLKLTNVYFHNSIDKNSVPLFLKKMDLLFLAFSKRKIYMYGVNTNKLYDYMMSEVPVLQVQTAGNDLVADSGCGISVEAENYRKAANAVLYIMNLTADERTKMGAAGKKYVLEHNTYSTLAENYLDNIFK